MRSLALLFAMLWGSLALHAGGLGPACYACFGAASSLNGLLPARVPTTAYEGSSVTRINAPAGNFGSQRLTSSGNSIPAWGLAGKAGTWISSPKPGYLSTGVPGSPAVDLGGRISVSEGRATEVSIFLSGLGLFLLWRKRVSSPAFK